MENDIENNKIIAEFLNWEFDDLSETFETPFLKLVEPQAFGDEQFSCKLQDFELEFHSDWNWLMEVVEKIENLSKEGETYMFSITKFSARVTYKGSRIVDLPIDNTKIEAVYNACVEFIKWYIKQNK